MIYTFILFKGRTPLHVASANHKIDAVEYLLSHKANIEATDIQVRIYSCFIRCWYKQFIHDKLLCYNTYKFCLT